MVIVMLSTVKTLMALSNPSAEAEDVIEKYKIIIMQHEVHVIRYEYPVVSSGCA